MYILLQLFTVGSVYLLGYTTLHLHMCGSTVTRRHPGLVLLVQLSAAHQCAADSPCSGVCPAAGMLTLPALTTCTVHTRFLDALVSTQSYLQL